MSRNREQLICDAMDAALAKGIKIVPGAAFNWTDCPHDVTFEKFKMPKPTSPPSTCSAIGALELALGRERNYPEGYTTRVCEYLGVGTYWLYRFHMGFDRARQLVYKVQDKDNKLVDKEDNVSKLGLKLRKRYYAA